MNVRKLYPCIILAALLAAACGKDKEAAPGSAAPAKAVVAVPPAEKAPAKAPAQEPAEAIAKAPAKTPAETAASKKASLKKPTTAKAKSPELPAGAATNASAKTKASSAPKGDFLAEVADHSAAGEGAGPGGKAVFITVNVTNKSAQTMESGTVLAKLREPSADYRYRYLERFQEIKPGASRTVTFKLESTKPLSGSAALMFQARSTDRLRSNTAVYEFDAATLLPQGESMPESFDPLNPAASGNSLFQVGEVMKDFTLPDITGKKVPLSSLPGKSYLLFICAAWSPHCAQLPPITAAWHKKYRDKGLQIVEIFFGDPTKIKEFAAKKAIPHTVLVATQAEIGKIFKLRAIPVFYLMNTDRKVEWRRDGFKDMLRIEFEVEQVLEGAME